MRSRLLPPFFTALIGLALLVGAGPALAAGTPSGTNVQNFATVDYDVGGIGQNTVTSNTVSFFVDNRISHTVATSDLAIVPVIPGTNDQIQTFTVRNDGNTTQDYSLTAPHSPTGAFGETETFDATVVRIFVDVNGNDIYDGPDVNSYIDELQADSTVTVFVLANIPLAQVDTDVSSFDLVAQVAVGGAPGSPGGDILTDDRLVAEVPGTVQTVFADAAGTAGGDIARDGRHSSKDGYKVQSAALGVLKSSLVTNDPINGGANPKAIPGATVDYTIDVDNTGAAVADAVEIVDTIPANTDFLVGSVGTVPAGATVAYSDDNGTSWGYSPIAGANGEDAAVTDVRVTFASIASGASAQTVFQVLIQ